jgi:hypothetical protein
LGSCVDGNEPSAPIKYKFLASKFKLLKENMKFVAYFTLSVVVCDLKIAELPCSQTALIVFTPIQF